MARRLSLLERLAKYSEDGPGACRLWTASKFWDGYGRIWVSGRSRAAHRIAYEKAHGPIPAGMCVCHKCDVPACINLDHLFLGTAEENQLDKIRKGRARSPRGLASGRAKLSDAQIIEIAALTIAGSEPTTAIASRFGITPRHVLRIRAGYRLAVPIAGSIA